MIKKISLGYKSESPILLSSTLVDKKWLDSYKDRKILLYPKEYKGEADKILYRFYMAVSGSFLFVISYKNEDRPDFLSDYLSKLKIENSRLLFHKNYSSNLGSRKTTCTEIFNFSDVDKFKKIRIRNYSYILFYFTKDSERINRNYFNQDFTNFMWFDEYYDNVQVDIYLELKK